MRVRIEEKAGFLKKIIRVQRSLYCPAVRWLISIGPGSSGLVRAEKQEPCVWMEIITEDVDGHKNTWKFLYVRNNT